MDTSQKDVSACFRRWYAALRPGFCCPVSPVAGARSAAMSDRAYHSHNEHGTCEQCQRCLWKSRAACKKPRCTCEGSETAVRSQKPYSSILEGRSRASRPLPPRPSLQRAARTRLSVNEEELLAAAGLPSTLEISDPGTHSALRSYTRHRRPSVCPPSTALRSGTRAQRRRLASSVSWTQRCLPSSRPLRMATRRPCLPSTTAGAQSGVAGRVMVDARPSGTQPAAAHAALCVGCS